MTRSCKCGRRKNLSYYRMDPPDGLRFLRCASCGKDMTDILWEELTIKEKEIVAHSVTVHESEEERVKYGAL